MTEFMYFLYNGKIILVKKEEDALIGRWHWYAYIDRVKNNEPFGTLEEAYTRAVTLINMGLA